MGINKTEMAKAAHALIVEECEMWACWKTLSESEQNEVYEGYLNIFEAGAEWHEAKNSNPGDK